MNKFLRNKEDITAWLDNYYITNYTLVPDKHYGFVVDVKDNVFLSDKKLSFIPIKFNKLNGNFYCGKNKLTSLEFCPQEVGGSFYCNDNQLTNLEFCPQKVEGVFGCHYNKLTTLEFCPQEVGNDFLCEGNQLTSLEFCPNKVGEDFYCKNNPELGELQKITDFSLIYQEHLKYKEKKDLAYKLEKELDTNIKSIRIKI